MWSSLRRDALSLLLHDAPLLLVHDAQLLLVHERGRCSRVVRPYRPFYRRPWFGTVVGGVALGTIATVAVVGAAPAAAPAPDLCWYWADAGMS